MLDVLIASSAVVDRPALYYVGLLVWTVLQVTFVVLYATRPWWSSLTGRALMTKSAVLAVWLVAIHIHYHVHELPFVVWTVLAWVMAAAVAWQLGVLIASARRSI